MRQFLVALLVIWTAACIAAYVYSSKQDIPESLTLALLPAILIEIGLYLATGFQTLRRQFERVHSKALRAALLTGSAALPYILASAACGGFRWSSLLAVAVLAGIASFWFAVLPRGPVADFLFLLFMGGVYLTRIFGVLYPHLTPRTSLEIMGHLMWVRVGIMAVLSIRGFENIRFGFVPSRTDWSIGIQLYLIFLPVAGVVAYAFDSLHVRVLGIAWWEYAALVIVTFIGMLWVVAMGEEFFFRGFLQQLLSKGLRSEAIGLVVASSVFGLVHLPFRNFPNWRMVALTAILGLFCGVAFMRARSVRAAMVTHALVATTFRLFFTT
jgi:membrane protease YdiL (CAAX protease family)